MDYYKKYLKYREKYRALKQSGGFVNPGCCMNDCGRSRNGSFSTCCGACKGPAGHHTSLCDSKTPVCQCGRKRACQKLGQYFPTCCSQCQTGVHTLTCNNRNINTIIPNLNVPKMIVIKGLAVKINLYGDKLPLGAHITVCYILPAQTIRSDIQARLNNLTNKYINNVDILRFSQMWGSKSALVDSSINLCKLQKGIFDDINNILGPQYNHIIDRSRYASGMPVCHVDIGGNMTTFNHYSTPRQVSYSLDLTAFN